MTMTESKAEAIRKWVDERIESSGLTKREAARLRAKLGEPLGMGADGYVMAYGPTRAIKFNRNPGRHTVKQIRDLVGRLRGERMVAHVYEVRRLGNSYYMIMERLNCLTKADLDIYWSRRRSPVWDSFIAGLQDLENRKGLYHADLHSGNIMRRNGKWVFVDVESFLY